MTRGALLLGLGLLASCGEALLTYPLRGQLYDEVADCLEEEGVLDVIEGEVEGTCEGVRCFRSLESGDSFVTTQCQAPPGYEDQSAEVGGVCEKALAAFARGDAICPDGA